MKNLITIAIFISMLYLLVGCGKTDIVANEETKPQQSEEITVAVDSPTETPANITIEEPSSPPTPTLVPEPVTTMEPSFYDITTGDFGDYNIIFEINGYLYRFYTEIVSNDTELDNM